jgi:phage tail-like protein
MRGLLPGLPSPHPMERALPALYLDQPSDADPLGGDPLSVRMIRAFDEVLAPVLATLDNLDAYLDPSIAPLDFLEWLGNWVGVVADETWDVERRRQAIAQSVDVYRMRGTVLGLRKQVEISTGGTVEIVDNGNKVGWSGVSGAPLPGRPKPRLLVRITVADPAALDRTSLETLVAAAKPAHMPHEIEVLQG